MASPKTRYVSINLLPHQVEKLGKLVKASGTNRNNLLRHLIERLTPSDIDEIMHR